MEMEEKLLVEGEYTEKVSIRRSNHKYKLKHVPLILLIVAGFLVTAALFDFIGERIEARCNSGHATNCAATNSSFSLPVTYPSNECWRVQVEERLDCCPELHCLQDECEKRDCCWNPLNGAALNDTPFNGHSGDRSSHPPIYIPYCYYPLNGKGYNLTSVKSTHNGLEAVISRDRNSTTGHPNDVLTLSFEAKFLTDNTLHVRILDKEKNRYVPPYPVLNKPTSNASNPLYEVRISKKHPFAFSVVRKIDGLPIFDTNTASPLIFADQFIEFSAKLTSTDVYGLGEHSDRLKRNFNWNGFTFWNSDAIPEANQPLYGSQPFYLSLEDSGRAHGVFMFNSNAMEIILRPESTITFRTIGGIIDLYFFLGPTPAEVVSQYTQLIGRPAFPPHWSLGYHLCRYGYKTLNRTRYINKINRDAGVPVQTQWSDIDYMDRFLDFTVDPVRYKGLGKFVEELHSDGLNYVMITDPGISAKQAKGTYPAYDLGHELDIFIKNNTGQELVGKVWAGDHTVYPDFTHPKSQQYWTSVINGFHKQVPFDGMWIDMNEPSNFVDGSSYGCTGNDSIEYPQYIPDLRFLDLKGKTICASAKQYAGIHYDLHNLYGLTESMRTYDALKTVRNQSRPFVLSRSNFAGSGQWSGSWSGDVTATWEQMQKSIPYILNFNMFGIPLAGADICGFSTNTTIELCARWQQLGSFYPFSRNHADLHAIDHDPASMGGVVLTATKNALRTRYRLLPYFYTLFYKAHTKGETVARALFFEFPQDSVAKFCDWQFLIGSGLMVAPVLQPQTKHVSVYFPIARWYDFYNGLEIGAQSDWVEMDAPFDKINLFQRGGSILPMQNYSMTTEAVRRSPFTISVALDESSESFGELFYDDGDTFEYQKSDQYAHILFTVKNNTLQSQIVHFGMPSLPKLKTVQVFGVQEAPKRVVLNNQEVKFSYVKSVLIINDMVVAFNKEFILMW